MYLPSECRYIIKVHNNDTNQDETHPIEFLKANRSDNWYILSQNRSGHFYAEAEHKVSMENIISLGWWRCSDTEHPYYTPPAEMSTQGAEQEIISGGLHHIVTTQRTSPLTKEQPPVILPAIICSTSQGEAIPTDIPPAAACNSPRHGNVTIALYNKPPLRGHAASSSLHQVWGRKERRRKGVQFRHHETYSNHCWLQSHKTIS